MIRPRVCPSKETRTKAVSQSRRSRAAKSPARRFRPWSGLIPRYWTPIIGQTDLGDIELGAFTSAYDVVGQHSYSAQLLFDPARIGEPEGGFGYVYSGFGNPVLDVGVTGYWTHQYLVNAQGVTVATLTHSTIAPSIGVTLLRPLVRTNLTWTVGAELQFRDDHTDPSPLLAQLPRVYSTAPRYPSLFSTLSWTNAKYPGIAISPEDGIAVSITGEQRWEWQNGAATTRSVVGVVSGYQAIALPGFAHHVLAARIAAGWEDVNATSEFGAGGRRSGLRYRRGAGHRHRRPAARLLCTQVRSQLRGGHAPRPSARSSIVSVVVHPPRAGSTSSQSFSVAPRSPSSAMRARAWCPSSPLPAACSPGDVQRKLLASVGGELNFDATLQYDVPYRFRLGHSCADRQSPTLRRGGTRPLYLPRPLVLMASYLITGTNTGGISRATASKRWPPRAAA